MPDTPPPTPRPRYALVSDLMKRGADRVITMVLVFVVGTAFVRCNGIPTEPVHPPDVPIAGPVQPRPRPRPDVPVQPGPGPVGPVQPKPSPVGNRPALVLTADEYLRNFGPNFSAVADRIASGELATRDAILGALGENSAPFNESLAAAIGKACSPAGTVDDKDGLAKVFKQVGEATGGK